MCQNRIPYVEDTNTNNRKLHMVKIIGAYELGTKYEIPDFQRSIMSHLKMEMESLRPFSPGCLKAMVRATASSNPLRKPILEEIVAQVEVKNKWKWSTFVDLFSVDGVADSIIEEIKICSHNSGKYPLIRWSNDRSGESHVKGEHGG